MVLGGNGLVNRELDGVKSLCKAKGWSRLDNVSCGLCEGYSSNSLSSGASVGLANSMR